MENGVGALACVQDLLQNRDVEFHRLFRKQQEMLQPLVPNEQGKRTMVCPNPIDRKLLLNAARLLEAGNNNAVLYTLIENCKAQGLNPRDYLEYVLENYGDNAAENLTPAKIARNWEAAAKSA